MAGPARSGASRYAFDELVEFAGDLLAAAGLGGAQARAVAEVLAEADLLGHDTHGLQLLASYLAELEKGAMTKDGEPRVLAERASVATWTASACPAPGSCATRSTGRARVRRCTAPPPS